MTSILRQLPFQERNDEVTVGLERVPIKAYQIIVRVILTPRDILSLPPHSPRFPAVLDTAHSHNFSLRASHLTRRARVDDASLGRSGQVRERGRTLPLYGANLWLHRNLPGTRDEFSETPPFLLLLREGIAVYPGEGDFPRLPRLGLRALVRNRLHLTMDSERCQVNLRTPDWRTKLLRLFA